ncbi:hypothetical protein B0H11DRAFT_1700199 [Mycena galericulata]|nr:hypothetical protein B0H11DRAFT_1700199 [Mycena galericulata]
MSSPRTHRKGPNPKPRVHSDKCSTLLEDEMTRCSDIPTHGGPIKRCRVHHEQYQTMTRRYKEAQKFVDETLAGALIPTKEEVSGYTSIPTILEKARLMKKYVNAIREERTGRDIHHNRFFMKVDDGHKIRIKVLAKQMTEGVEIRDALEARALALHLENHPAKDWVEEFQSPLDDEDESIGTAEDAMAYMRARQDDLRAKAALNENDDLIGLRLRFEREQYLNIFEHIIEPEQFWIGYFREKGTTPPDTPEERNKRKEVTSALLQYTRRIIFHDPHLLAKSSDKVSFKDLVMDDDFGLDDILRVANLYQKRMHIGLRWWKDSLTEAIRIKDSSEASANMGSLANRFKILGGWIYNSSRDVPASNKVWWTLLTADRPEKDTENRYVRLCCNFDELHTFLSLSALVLSDNTPTFCTDSPEFNPRRDSGATRNHLSLCGVVLTDLVQGNRMFNHSGPFPSTIPAKKPGCITWAEFESRAYMFGAIRDEPDDFSIAFLRELRARPDLFTVVTRSDTDPPLKLESFGNVTDQMRTRQFEAPFQPVHNAPSGRGTWQVIRSTENVLYGGLQGALEKKKGMDTSGYLTPGYNNTKGEGGRKEQSFFYFKRFPVKYFLILSASATENVHDLARQVAWAAFRAHGLVHGNYDKARYDKASDVLFTKHARERLSFLPEGSFTVGNLASAN